MSIFNVNCIYVLLIYHHHHHHCYIGNSSSASSFNLGLNTTLTKYIIQVDAAVVRFKLKKSSECPPVSSTKSFFSMVFFTFGSYSDSNLIHFSTTQRNIKGIMRTSFPSSMLILLPICKLVLIDL